MKRQILIFIVLFVFIGSCAVVYMMRNELLPRLEAAPAGERSETAAQSAPVQPKEVQAPPKEAAPAPAPLEAPLPAEQESELGRLLKNRSLPCCKMTLKQLVDASEARIKVIDKVLKAREDEKTVRELITKGDELRVEEKFADARKDYEEALKLATDLMVRKEIRIKERLARKKSSARCPSISCNTR